MPDLQPPTPNVGKVTGLFIYPIKSCAGVELKSMPVDELGPIWDRRMVVVDEKRVFISQRTDPVMARIIITLEDHQLRINCEGSPELILSMGMIEQGTHDEVTVWKDPVIARNCGAKAAKWFSAILKRPVQLFSLDPKRPRESARGLGFLTGFADAYPFLLGNLASLNDLNKRMTKPLPMSRFRPNIVVSNQTPYSEDTWKYLKIGSVVFAEIKACKRCSITTVDPHTGVVDGKEPLSTLSSYRKTDAGEVLFCVNLSHSAPGIINVGDDVVDLSGS